MSQSGQRERRFRFREIGGREGNKRWRRRVGRRRRWRHCLSSEGEKWCCFKREIVIRWMVVKLTRSTACNNAIAECWSQPQPLNRARDHHNLCICNLLTFTCSDTRTTIKCHMIRNERLSKRHMSMSPPPFFAMGGLRRETRFGTSGHRRVFVAASSSRVCVAVVARIRHHRPRRGSQFQLTTRPWLSGLFTLPDKRKSGD